MDGIKSVAGPGITVTYAAAEVGGRLVPASAVLLPDGSGGHGFQAEYFKNRDLNGAPALTRVEEEIHVVNAGAPPAPGMPPTDFSARWTGRLVAPKSGDYVFNFTGDDGFRVYLDGKPLIDHWTQEAATTITATTTLEAGRAYDLRVEYFQAGGDFVARFAWQPPGDEAYAEAVAAARNSDVAVVCVSTLGTEGEGSDRPSMDLPGNQSALIRAVAAVNHNTIVVLNNGTPVVMRDWLGQVPALLEAWFPGQEGGTAVADILFGAANPSGKLPDTLAAYREDYPDFGNFPGANHQVTYAEGIYVGYRHFDKAAVTPLFCFGEGLSYTTFKYKKLRLSQRKMQPDGSVTATVEITNTGQRSGEEVAQLYIHDLHPQIDKPVRELKGFHKVALNPGETRTVTFTLKPRNLAYFDVAGHQWKADAGGYEVDLGASSRDIRLKSVLHLAGTFTENVP